MPIHETKYYGYPLTNDECASLLNVTMFKHDKRTNQTFVDPFWWLQIDEKHKRSY